MSPSPRLGSLPELLCRIRCLQSRRSMWKVSWASCWTPPPSCSFMRPCKNITFSLRGPPPIGSMPEPDSVDAKRRSKSLHSPFTTNHHIQTCTSLPLSRLPPWSGGRKSPMIARNAFLPISIAAVARRVGAFAMQPANSMRQVASSCTGFALTAAAKSAGWSSPARAFHQLGKVSHKKRSPFTSGANHFP